MNCEICGEAVGPLSDGDFVGFYSDSIFCFKGESSKKHQVRPINESVNDTSVNELKELIRHCWVHSGYDNCGYDKMTTAQKHLYNSIVDNEQDGE